MMKTKAEQRKIIDLYKVHSLKEVAKQMGCATLTVRSILVANGVKIRQPNNPTYKPTLEEIEREKTALRGKW